MLVGKSWGESNFFVFIHSSENVALDKRTRGPDLPQYGLNCTKFVKSILRKIIEIVATRCHIFS